MYVKIQKLDYAKEGTQDIYLDQFILRLYIHIDTLSLSLNVCIYTLYAVYTYAHTHNI